MMGKRIESLLGVSAFSLIILIGIGMFEVGLCISPIADCTNETYAKLDDASLSIDKIDEIMLSIPKNYTALTPIGRVTVAELLRLKEPCSVRSKIYQINLIKVKHLGCPPKRTLACDKDDDESDEDSKDDGPRCIVYDIIDDDDQEEKEPDYPINAGAVKFLRHYQPLWEASCTEALRDLYKHHLEKLTDEQRKILDGIVEAKLWTKFVRGHNGAADDLIRQYRSDPTRSSLLKSACRQLDVGAPEYQPSVVHDEFAEDWSQMVQVCRSYLFTTGFRP